MQFTTDGVKASLHFTKTNTQPEEEEEKTKSTITKLTNGVLVVTIGPNGKYSNSIILRLREFSFFQRLLCVFMFSTFGLKT